MPDETDLPDMNALPKRVDRRKGADLVSRFFFPVSHRSLETWPVATRVVNGRALMETAELLAFAASRLEAAPKVMGGRKARER